MQYALFQVAVLRRLLTIETFFLVFISFFMFLLASVALVNVENIVSVLESPYTQQAKFYLIYIITTSFFNVFTISDLLFLFISAFLFALNFVVVYKRLVLIKKGGGLRLVFSSGILSIVSVGCASCGLSIASIVGLGSVVALLPFRGIELYIFSIMLLLVLLVHNIKGFLKVCKISDKSFTGKIR